MFAHTQQWWTKNASTFFNIEKTWLWQWTTIRNILTNKSISFLEPSFVYKPTILSQIYFKWAKLKCTNGKSQWAVFHQFWFRRNSWYTEFTTCGTVIRNLAELRSEVFDLVLKATDQFVSSSLELQGKREKRIFFK